MPVEPSAFALLHRRSLFAAVLALAACDSDTTPIVESVPAGGGARLASANATDRGAALSDREPDYKLGPNDKVRIIVFGQPTLTGEFSLDGNGVLAFPLIGNVSANGITTTELQKAIAASSTRATWSTPASAPKSSRAAPST